MMENIERDEMEFKLEFLILTNSKRKITEVHDD